MQKKVTKVKYRGEKTWEIENKKQNRKCKFSYIYDIKYLWIKKYNQKAEIVRLNKKTTSRLTADFLLETMEAIDSRTTLSKYIKGKNKTKQNAANQKSYIQQSYLPKIKAK